MKRAVYDLTPLATNSRFRGIGTYTWDLGRALCEAAVRGELPDGLSLELLVGTPGRYALWTPAAALDFSAVVAACGGERTVGYQAYYWDKRSAQRAFLERSRIDLLHAPDPKGTATSQRYRTVVTAHDLIPTVLGWPYRSYPRALSAWIDRRRYLPHDHVIAISEWTAHDLERVLGLPRAKISVVHHGADHTRFGPQTGAALPDAPYFFYVGGFDERKQVIPLIRAFASVASGLPEQLLIAGRPYPAQRTAMEKAIARGGVSGRVRLMGFVPSEALPGLYRDATAHVLPSRYEGFGLTALEAMTAGCPVVALRATSLPEVCGDAAEWVEDTGLDGLGRALTRLSRDATLRSDLRARGLARAAQFTWSQAARQTLAAYQRVLA